MKRFIIFLTFMFIMLFSMVVSAKELPSQNNVSVNKVWTINLNQAIDYTTLQDIAVADKYGNNIAIDKMVTTDGRQIAVSPQVGAWGYGSTYTITIKNVKSRTGQELKEPITLTFTTEGTNFYPSDAYATDEKYIYDNYGTVTWQEGNIYTNYRCYQVYVKEDGNTLYVFMDTDVNGIGNIVSSKNSLNAMDTQLQAVYSYMKHKYPDKVINVGLYFNEALNKYPEGTDSKDVSYDPATGKYKEILILAGLGDDGTKYFINQK